MKRRLDIALGLVHRPSVLFLDEPTTGLDPEARAAMWVEVQRLAEQERLTILLTTHYLEEADRLPGGGAVGRRGGNRGPGAPGGAERGLRGGAGPPRRPPRPGAGGPPRRGRPPPGG